MRYFILVIWLVCPDFIPSKNLVSREEYRTLNQVAYMVAAKNENSQQINTHLEFDCYEVSLGNEPTIKKVEIPKIEGTI